MSAWVQLGTRYGTRYLLRGKYVPSESFNYPCLSGLCITCVHSLEQVRLGSGDDAHQQR